jgi:hypothetical protein
MIILAVFLSQSHPLFSAKIFKNLSVGFFAFGVEYRGITVPEIENEETEIGNGLTPPRRRKT